MRILSNNLADSAIISASPAMVATLPETNLQTALREQVARWTAVDGQAITVTWPGSKAVSCVCLYRGNFSATATWRVRVWADGAMTTTAYDSGTAYICPPVPLGGLEWGVDPLSKNLYSDWDYAIAVAWFAPVLAAGVTIDVYDPENLDGYVQASRLFVGQHFEPAVGVSSGMQLGYRENSQQARTEGGSLRVEAGAIWRTLQVDTREMAESDRLRMIDIARNSGMRNDVFVSVFPGRADELERDYQLQARLAQQNPFTTNVPLIHNATLTFEEL